ncbi:MAG: FAD-dependent oxidoreductase [bacterium]|nr:FAD-dependent oxidoreductase [bacterium]
MQKANIGIIGAGIVGTAIARHLALKYKDRLDIKVLEKHPSVCMETSRFNSGVNHSGFHQKPGSLKARLAFRGSQLMKSYVETNLPERILNCGMLIAISRQERFSSIFDDLSSLAHLFHRGAKQNINFEFLGPWGVRKIEPHIKVIGGIFIPQVSVIDPVVTTSSLYVDAAFSGVKFIFNSKVRRIIIDGNYYLVFTDKEEYRFECLINSAGLYADEIASLAGVNQYTIYPWRGEYYKLINLPLNYVNSLIYPAVSKNSPSKGIHFRPDMYGNVFMGPSAKLVKSKDDYDSERVSAEVFLKAAQKFFPDISLKNLVPSYAGIRPKLRKDGGEEDFIIRIDHKKPLLINLIAIESPGLSASMAIGEYVSKLIGQVLTR